VRNKALRGAGHRGSQPLFVQSIPPSQLPALRTLKAQFPAPVFILDEIPVDCSRRGPGPVRESARLPSPIDRVRSHPSAKAFSPASKLTCG